MNIETLIFDSSSADCAVARSDDLSPHLLHVVWAGLAAACALQCRDDPEAARVAEWFFPELGGFDHKSLSQGLSTLIAGEHPPGEVDLAGFSEANPALAGYLSPAAHGLFKLSVGVGFSSHGPVIFSRGDCQDLGHLLRYCQPTLEQHGLHDDAPFGRGLGRFSSLLQAAIEHDGQLRLNG